MVSKIQSVMSDTVVIVIMLAVSIQHGCCLIYAATVMLHVLISLATIF
jgi:hypothetical protein